MAGFTAKWELTPHADGKQTMVKFTMWVDPDLPLVPDDTVSEQNRKKAGKTIKHLRKRIAGEL